MTEKFKVEFLPEAVEFMDNLDQKSRQKIYYYIKKAQLTNDPELFKKLNENIWEFITKPILEFLPFGINRKDNRL